MGRWRAIAGLLLVAALAASACADEIIFQVIGPRHPSSFAPQYRVKVVNEAFLSLNLLEKITRSELLIDGRPALWAGRPFTGPAGLAPQAGWEGCLELADYRAAPTAGKHRLQWVSGPLRSKEITVRFPAAEPPAAGAAGRLRQAKDLIAAIEPGLPRSCVENWLTQRDGGIQEDPKVP